MSADTVIANCRNEQLDVVVVDDDDLTLDIVSWIFKRTTIKHRLFADTDIAMQYLGTNMPSTLIVDYYMPTINGIEFLRQVSEQGDNRECALYLCSGIRPPQRRIDQLEELGAVVLDKSAICGKTSLLALVDAGRQAAGQH